MQNFSKEINKLRETNKSIVYKGEEMLLVLQEIEYILCSLHNMGSYYWDKDRKEYEKETTKFIDNSLVCERLAEIRAILSSGFDLEEGEDEMDDIERVCEDIPFWEKPGGFSTKRWLK